MTEYILYHYPICPFSRKVRVFLNELNIKYTQKEVKFWNREEFFIKLNPAGETPVLFDKQNNFSMVDSFLIADFLEEMQNKTEYSYNGCDVFETKRIEMWFDKKFYNEVSKYILEERVYSTFTNKSVNSRRLKAGQKNLDGHLAYMEYLLGGRIWLAGEDFTIADITAAGQISSLDYLGEINWNKYKVLKKWYSVIKSKPSFRDILWDKIEVIPPSKNYKSIDFD